MDFEALRNGVAVLDLTGRPLACTQSLCALLGLKGDGRDELAVLLRESPALGRLLASGGAGALNLPGDRVLTVNVEKGDGVHLLTFSDEGPRRFQQLFSASKVEAMSLLSEGMAHDARNPLNAMAINVEVLNDRLRAADPALASVLSKYTKAIRDQIIKVDGIIRRFVEFASPHRAEGASVDLAEIVGRAVEVCGHDARKNRVKVESKLGVGKVQVQGDSMLLAQAILHLVMDGIARNAGGGQLDIALEPSDSEAVLSLSDAAVGGEPARDQRRDLPLFVAREIFNLQGGQLTPVPAEAGKRGHIARLPLTSKTVR